MRKIKVLLFSLVFSLTACKEDTPPELEIAGHWIVDHGFFENQCQVGATFTDELMVLTFYSLYDGACQPELFDIGNNALPIQIYEQESYLDEDGSLAADLALAAPERGVAGKITLTESVDGLSGALTEANDPEGLLEPLLQPTYQLTRMPDGWIPLIEGRWGVSCDQIDAVTSTDDLCGFIDFTDVANGRMTIYTQLQADLTPDPSLPTISLGDGTIFTVADATFALRHVEQTGDADYTLDFVIIPDMEPSASIAAKLFASGGTVELSLTMPTAGLPEPQVETVELIPFID